MKEKVITDNSSERITVKWDDGKFAIVKVLKQHGEVHYVSSVVLNPREMLDLIEFACVLGGK